MNIRIKYAYLIITAIFISCIFGLAITTAEMVESRWPMFLHDLQHTGRSEVSGPSIPAVTSYPLDFGYSSPVIASDGTVYIATLGPP